MGVLDKFLDVMKLNGDDDEYDDDFYDEDDDFEDESYEEEKPKKNIFGKKDKPAAYEEEEEDYQLVQIKSPRCASLLHAEMLLQWKFV